MVLETSFSRKLTQPGPDPVLSRCPRCPRCVDGLNAKGNMSQYWARAVHGLAGLDGSRRAKKPAWEWNGGLGWSPRPRGSPAPAAVRLSDALPLPIHCLWRTVASGTRPGVPPDV